MAPAYLHVPGGPQQAAVETKVTGVPVGSFPSVTNGGKWESLSWCGSLWTQRRRFRAWIPVPAGIAVPILWAATPDRLPGLRDRRTRAPARPLRRAVGQTLIGTAVVALRFRKLTSDIVLSTYYAVGLGKPDKADHEIRYGSPVSR